MQIDFIGCTSAGKSTLIEHILRAAATSETEAKLEFLTREMFVLQLMRLDWIDSRIARTVLVDLAALFGCLVSLPQHLRFYRFAFGRLSRSNSSLFDKVNLLRNVLKKFGIHELIRRAKTASQLILVDEGTLQAAHNLFVYRDAEYDAEGVTRFLALVPLPDIVVYLRQPDHLLVDRILVRGHRRVNGTDEEDVACFVHQAVVIFETLIHEPEVSKRLLVIDGTGHADFGVGISPETSMMKMAINLISDGLNRSRGVRV